MGYIYLINKSNTIDYKIGITKNNVSKRLKQLQTGSSDELLLINSFESKHYKRIERFLHKKYYNNHVHGEWFELTDEEVFQFISLCEKYDKDCEVMLTNCFMKKPT